MSFFSALLGLDSSHAAGQAQNQANQQTAQANAYGAQAGNIYGGLNQQGQGQQQVYQNNYLGLLNKFGATAGVGPYAATGGPTQGSAGAYVGNRQPFSAATPAQSEENNPYNLDVHQQERINQTKAGLAQSAQQAVSSFQSQMAQRGITDPRALQVGTEQIQEHYAALSAEQETAFYESVKQDKLKALQTLLSGVEGYGKTGIAQQEAAASGYLGLQGGAQNQAVTQQNLSNQQRQLSNDQLGGLLNIGGFALGGGFSKAPTGTPPITFTDGGVQ